MHSIDPLTAAARSQILTLADEIAEAFPAYWGRVPRTFLALKVREWARQIEDSNVWEPKHVKRIVRAVFSPAPELISQDEMDYVMSVLSHSGAGGEARSRTIWSALSPRL
ncbi:hypothetical protein [Yoonia sp. 2307UL14-13]|uniref:hypothetical protein n=1 Tax=Yoonia sp. 2307UL14-13 TaxID=3126506 RepID=UPI0030A06BB0